MRLKRPRNLKPPHPGKVLLEEFLKPMDLSRNRLASSIAVPPRRINEIVLGKRSITADTALRLGRYFKMSPQFWLGLQMDYDFDVTADRLENHPRFLRRIEKARQSLRAGKGTRLEDLDK